jgi:hypothetical protein
VELRTIRRERDLERERFEWNYLLHEGGEINNDKGRKGNQDERGIDLSTLS